jgi:hypothetical protein
MKNLLLSTAALSVIAACAPQAPNCVPPEVEALGLVEPDIYDANGKPLTAPEVPVCEPRTPPVFVLGDGEDDDPRPPRDKPKDDDDGPDEDDPKDDDDDETPDDDEPDDDGEDDEDDDEPEDDDPSDDDVYPRTSLPNAISFAMFNDGPHSVKVEGWEGEEKDVGAAEDYGNERGYTLSFVKAGPNYYNADGSIKAEGTDPALNQADKTEQFQGDD